MNSISIKPTKGAVSVGIWQMALWTVYAGLIVQMLSLGCILGRNGQFAQIMGGAHHHLSMPALMAFVHAQPVLLGTILLAVVLLIYLNLKVSVSAGDRDRLYNFKARPEVLTESSEYLALRDAHNSVAPLLIAAGIISEDELQHVHELGKHTKRLLGNSIVGYNWISAENWQRAMDTQKLIDGRMLSQAQAVAQLSDARISRDLAHHTWHEDEDDLELEPSISAICAPSKKQTAIKPVETGDAVEAEPVEQTPIDCAFALADQQDPWKEQAESQSRSARQADVTSDRLTAIQTATSKSLGAVKPFVAVQPMAAVQPPAAVKSLAAVQPPQPVAPSVQKAAVQADDQAEELMSIKERIMSAEGDFRTGKPMEDFEKPEKVRRSKPAKKNQTLTVRMSGRNSSRKSG